MLFFGVTDFGEHVRSIVLDTKLLVPCLKCTGALR